MKDHIAQERKSVPTNDRLDSMLPEFADAAVEFVEGVRGTSGFVDDRYVDCRGCGFPLAIGRYHVQTGELVESCHRCGFSCSYPLESCVPSIIAEHDSGFEMEAFLASGSCASIECSDCGTDMFVFLDVQIESFCLLSYCPTCQRFERSRDCALPVNSQGTLGDCASATPDPDSDDPLRML